MDIECVKHDPRSDMCSVMIPLIISQSLKGSLEDQPAAGGVCDGGRRGRGSGDEQVECGEGGRRAARNGRRGTGEREPRAFGT